MVESLNSLDRKGFGACEHKKHEENRMDDDWAKDREDCEGHVRRNLARSRLFSGYFDTLHGYGSYIDWRTWNRNGVGINKHWVLEKVMELEY